MGPPNRTTRPRESTSIVASAIIFDEPKCTPSSTAIGSALGALGFVAFYGDLGRGGAIWLVGAVPVLFVAFPGLLWLTRQDRKDKDYALFGEASFDVTPQITITGGGRLYKFDNTLFGFAGYGRNLAFVAEGVPPNVVGSTRTGVADSRSRSRPAALISGPRVIGSRGPIRSAMRPA